ncbi:sensor domain-containing diguanylate cyclase [Solemya velesiana gill symbiont]|uniref:sensor domain-containing diguanylate cyclase n=1 Tax=Solemya velesiana gill symbiont TaxID=1918948 RepID=UPI00155F6C17|nr:diguanylate cyclase [Solemya velesiana gill symbiont]
MDKAFQSNQTALEQCPCGILVQDATGTVRWVNATFESMCGLKAEQLIGHNRNSLSSTALQALLGSDGPVHLISTEGDSEIVMQCTTTEGAEGETIRYYLDITELTRLQEQNGVLRQQVQELAITDELTGLANTRALNRSLNAQVTRNRRYGNSLSLVIAELTDSDSPEEDLHDNIILAVSRHLRNRLRWVDTIARWAHNKFVIILPETEQQECQQLITKIRTEFTEISLPDEHSDRSLALHFGTAQWQKGDDARKLLKKAAQELVSEEHLAANTA